MNIPKKKSCQVRVHSDLHASSTAQWGINAKSNNRLRGTERNAIEALNSQEKKYQKADKNILVLNGDILDIHLSAEAGEKIYNENSGKVNNPERILEILKSIVLENPGLFKSLEQKLKAGWELHFLGGNHDAAIFSEANPEGAEESQKFIKDRLSQSDKKLAKQIFFHQDALWLPELGLWAEHGHRLDPLAKKTNAMGAKIDRALLKFAVATLKNIEHAELDEASKIYLQNSIMNAFSVDPISKSVNYIFHCLDSSKTIFRMSKGEFKAIEQIKDKLAEDFSIACKSIADWSTFLVLGKIPQGKKEILKYMKRAEELKKRTNDTLKVQIRRAKELAKKKWKRSLYICSGTHPPPA